MAEKFEIELEVNVESNIEIAMTNIINFTQATERAGEAAEEAGEKAKNYGETLVGFGSAVLDNGTAMEILNEHTHGYFDKVSQVVEVSKLFVTQQKAAAAVQSLYSGIVGSSTGVMKVFRVALANTGVGAIVLALGYLIGNFEKVKNAVMNFIPGLGVLGDIFGGLVNWVTDFVGATSDASRALDEIEAKAQDGLKKDELAFESNSDLYDEFTKKKMKASLDYRNKVGEINREEKLSVEEKEQAITDAHNRMLRDIEQADKDSKAELNKFLDAYRKKQEEDDADTAIKKLALEEKKALAELDRLKATEAQKQAVRDFYQGKIDEEQANIDVEAKKKADDRINKAREEAKQKREAVKKILEDYDKKEEDALNKTNLQKINIEEKRVLKEMDALKATHEQKAKITAHYNQKRIDEETRLKKELEDIAEARKIAQRNLELDQKQWEIDHETDPKVKLEKQKVLLEEEVKLEINGLQKIIANENASEKDRADAQNQLAMVQQNLEQAIKDNKQKQDELEAEREDEKVAKHKQRLDDLAAKRQKVDFVASEWLDKISHKNKERTEDEIDYDIAVAQNRLNLGANTAKTLLELGGKGAELAKGMAAAQAIQDTYKGATSAYSSLAGIPVVGPALGAAAAGVAIASGLMNVKKILATKPVEKSAPGATGGGGGAAAPAAPAFNLVQGTGTNQIAEAIGGQNTPIQAYVVSSNVTTAQSLDRNIVEQSSL